MGPYNKKPFEELLHCYTNFILNYTCVSQNTFICLNYIENKIICKIEILYYKLKINLNC